MVKTCMGIMVTRLFASHCSEFNARQMQVHMVTWNSVKHEEQNFLAIAHIYSQHSNYDHCNHECYTTDYDSVIFTQHKDLTISRQHFLESSGF